MKFVLAADRNINISDDDDIFEVIRLFKLNQARAKEEAKILGKG